MSRLAIADSQRSLTVITLAVCLLGLAMTGRDSSGDDCRFEQKWYAGDVHFNEQIEFRTDSTGTWIQDGMASDAPHDRKEFRWNRTASTLTVTYDRDQQRTVDYHIERRGNACYLQFSDHPLLGDGPGFRLFADYP